MNTQTASSSSSTPATGAMDRTSQVSSASDKARKPQLRVSLPTLLRRRSSPLIRRSACPCCGATAAAWRPIRYGMVALSVYAQARRGEVVIGPVNHGRNEPQWACSSCDTRFGRAREELDRFGRPLAPAAVSAAVSLAAEVEVGSSRRRISRRKIHRVETLEPASLRDVDFGQRRARPAADAPDDSVAVAA